MRKSDKLKNFKKINLIVENRYLESKGIVPESSYNADGDEFNNLRGIADYGESEKTMAFRNVIDALKKIKNGAQPNEVNVGDALRRFKEYASEDEFQRVSNEYNNIITTHGSHIGMDESNHSITEYGQSKQFDLRDEQNMDSLISMIVSYLGKEKTNDASIANDNKVIVYTELLRKLMLMSPPSTLNNGENGNEIYTNNPEAMRNYLNKFKVGGDFKFIDSNNTPYDNGVDEGFFSGLKDKANRMFDISSKENEANKKKAIDEIVRFNFQSLFFQPGEGQVLRKDVAEQKVADAARAMPTVKQLNPQLFELKDGYFSNATMNINDKLYRGVIPSCFEFIRDVNDEISNDEAIRRVIGNLG